MFRIKFYFELIWIFEVIPESVSKTKRGRGQNDHELNLWHGLENFFKVIYTYKWI